MPGFVHLHVASGYSLRYGTSRPESLVARAVELGQDALALTDRDGAYGAVAFALACREAGISPILGVDLAVAVPEQASTPPRHRPGTPARGGV
jgi:error-prone DNA polymerase